MIKSLLSLLYKIPRRVSASGLCGSLRNCMLILFTFFIVSAHAQDETIFNVSKKQKVNIECRFDTLLNNSVYYFEIYSATAKSLIPGKFEGGEVWLNDTAVGIHTKAKTSADKKYRLELFLRKDGTSVFSKDFIILSEKDAHFRAPAFVGSRISIFAFGIDLTGNDFISSKKVNTDNPLFAFGWGNLAKEYKVVSFSMSIACGGKTATLNSKTSYFTPEMKNELGGIKEGCVITFKDVKYTSTNSSPDDTFAGPFKLQVKE
jgi:hypothetical protein